MISACDLRVRGVVQGVAFRPFVCWLQKANMLAGWALNDEEGIAIYAEGSSFALDEFVSSLFRELPTTATIQGIAFQASEPAALQGFTIRGSRVKGRPSVRIRPDLPVCEDSVAKIAQGLWDATDTLCEGYRADTVLLSGDVFRNELPLEDLKELNTVG